MIGNLSGKQILLIILGIIILFWLITWWITRNKKKTQFVQQIPSPTINTQNQNQNQNIKSDVPIFSRSSEPYVLHYFYSPKCKHCMNFTPVWKQVVSTLKQHGFNNIAFREIDITKPENENLIFYYNVNTVPVVILVTPNQIIEYTGERTPDDFYNFVVSGVSQPVISPINNQSIHDQ